jgi:hypothetical protein
MVQMKNTYKILGGKPADKKPLRRITLRLILKETGHEGVD